MNADGQGAGRANEQAWQRRRATMGCAFPGCFQWARGLSNYCPQHRPFHVETEEQEHARLMVKLEKIERVLHRWIPTLCLCIIIAAVVGLALRKGGFL